VLALGGLEQEMGAQGCDVEGGQGRGQAQALVEAEDWSWCFGTCPRHQRKWIQGQGTWSLLSRSEGPCSRIPCPAGTYTIES
jgi:hypothetical protein